MNYVAILIGPGHTAPLTEGQLSQAHSTLTQCGAEVEDIKWLAPGEAAELHFTSLNLDATQDALKQHFATTPLDIAILPGQGRKKQLLIADMDSTIIAVECIDELADFAGVKPQVAQITDAAMRGELDFNTALIQRVALLQGMPIEILERCYQERVRLNSGAHTLVQTMRANGATCALVSGGFTFFTCRISDTLGFHSHRANELGICSGKLTGKVIPPISNAATKVATLKELQNKFQLERKQILGVGDGANDIPMLEAAGLSIAYHAKPKTQAAADVAINHSDLTALLYLQGYRKDEFHTA